jgi:Fe-S-cluster containining protein
MTLQRIIDRLPKVYQNFLLRFFESNIPEETAATCNNCAMWEGGGPGFPGGVYFSRASKCCTHYPNLPNYLVGALLSNSSSALEEGRSRIRKTIKSRIGITPYGILRPKKYLLLLKNTEKGFFGRSKSLICPFYDKKKGKCTIRPFWDAICNTWFCKYTTGEDGREFWLALKRYLNFVEKTLVQYTLYKMEWDPQKMILLESPNDPLTLQEVDDQPPDQEAYRDLWGNWIDREGDFYKETFRLISALTPKEFVNISGISQKILLEEVKIKQKTLLNPKLPKILKRNPKLQVEKNSDDSYFLIGYSPLDPFEVSKRVYDLLDFFDGKRTNQEAYRLIRNNMGVAMEKDLLTSLYQFRILVGNEKV